ncbi:MAG: hypothetical protein HRU10_07090 [Opitutales bacterium]|nr:hypothetical protein [Opitutales bacterium]
MMMGGKWWVVSLIGLIAFLAGGFKVLPNVATNVLDLLPQEDEAPELQFLGLLSNKKTLNGMETIIRAKPDVTADPEEQLDIAKRFVAEIRKNPSIRSAYRIDDLRAYEGLGGTLFDERLSLLFPAWLHQQRDAWQRAGSSTNFDAYLADRAVERLDSFLDRIDAMAFEEMLPEDPLLLVPDLIETMQNNGRNPSSDASLLWVESVASPLAAEGQTPVLSGIEEAFATATQGNDSYEILFSGVAKFAEANRTGIYSEISKLNILGVLGVVIVAFIFMRPKRSVIAVVPLIFIALACGLWVSISVFDQVHAITLVIASILSGVVVDYGFHLVLSSKGERGVVIKPLVLSALSTAVGFAVLSAAPLPLLRQMGVFVCAGVLGAIFAGIFLFKDNKTHGNRPTWAKDDWDISSKVCRGIVAVAISIGVCLLIYHPIRFHDDIQTFNLQTEAIKAESLETREAFGRKLDTNLIFAFGDRGIDAIDTARRALDNNNVSEYASWAAGLTSTPDLEAVETWLSEQNFIEALKTSLGAKEFFPDLFVPFFEKFEAYAALTPEARLAQIDQAYRALSDSMLPHLRMLFQTGDDFAWIAQPMPPEFSIGETDETLFELNQVQNLNQVLAQYRDWVLRMSLYSFIGIAVTIVIVTGWHESYRVFSICLISLFLSIATQMVVFGHLPILSLIGLLLGFCLCLDYALFSQHAAHHCSRFPFSIVVSGLTTAVSFGVLSLSSVPAVASLGHSVLITVLIALALVFISFHDRRSIMGSTV